MIITINGVKAENFRLGKNDHCGFTEVFINNNNSRHWLPSHIVAKNSSYKSIAFKVNGNNYKVEQ